MRLAPADVSSRVGTWVPVTFADTSASASTRTESSVWPLQMHVPLSDAWGSWEVSSVLAEKMYPTNILCNIST